MEKIDANKFPVYSGDFQAIPASFQVGGRGEPVQTKKGPADTFVLVREDGLVVRLFADQLRQEGDKLLVSASALQKQIARAETFKQTPQKVG